MQIQSVGIIGGTNGLGARLADHFKHTFSELTVLVSGRDTELSNNKIVQDCDLIIFAVPIKYTESVIAECAPDSRPDQIWCDITSIKQGPVEAMLAAKAEVCGLHPLFGPLPVISGQPLIYCPARISPDSLENVLGLLSDFDCIEMTPEQHDDTMGVVQCVSHLSDLVMGATLRDSGLDFETIWRVSSPSYRIKLQVMGRMFAQNPDLYIDIATLNQSGSKFTARFQKALETLKDLIDQDERELLIKNFDQVRDYLTSEFCDQSYADSQQFMSLAATTPSVDPAMKKGVLAIFGQPFSHTDEAAASFFPNVESGDRDYFSQIANVFLAVSEGRFQSGVVPFENSTHGSVIETLDSLFAFPDIKIVASRERSIEQHLLVLPGTALDQIKTIKSHPQALAQSKAWLNKNIAGVAKIPERSTALAAQNLVAQQNPSQAVIGSRMLAKGLGLEVLAENLELAGNKTRFVEIRKTEMIGSGKHYLSFCFWFGSDKAGNLASALEFLADEGVNLIKLDSRRTTPDHGDYLFFVDAEVDRARFEKLENNFERLVSGFRILGSFDH